MSKEWTTTQRARWVERWPGGEGIEVTNVLQTLRFSLVNKTISYEMDSGYAPAAGRLMVVDVLIWLSQLSRVQSNLSAITLAPYARTWAKVSEATPSEKID